MRVLLTGASSFVGRHVAAHLAGAGHDLIATYRTLNPAIEELQARKSDRVSLLQLDIAHWNAFVALPTEIDAVVHIAGATTATGISIDEMLACNVTGTGNVLRYALAAHAKRLIYLSTMSVHGAIQQSVVDENTPIIEPNAYGASKLRGEQLLVDAADRLPSVAIRIPGVLGRGAHRAWLPTILETARRGGDIAVVNPDARFNNAVHVDDLARFIGELIARHLTGFSAFPIGAAQTITIRNAVESVIASTRGRSQIVVRSGHAPSFTISSDYAMRRFGYRPSEIGATIARYLADEASTLRAIIIGIDGTIGAALAAAIRAEGGEVYGTSRRPDARARGHIYLDLADSSSPETLLPDVDIAFFCAAMVQFDQCRAEPLLARQVNVVAPVALARALVGRGTRVVLLSTSAVYDGFSARVRESEPPNPMTDYGRLKAEAEAEFLSFGSAASVLRLTKVLTPEQPIFIRWIDALSRGELVTAFSDLGLAPISLAATIHALLAICRDGQGGIYQASAAADVAYLEAAWHVARRVDADLSLVIAQSGRDAGLPNEQLKIISSLDSSRLCALTGEVPPDPLTVIDEVFGSAMEEARTNSKGVQH